MSDEWRIYKYQRALLMSYAVLLSLSTVTDHRDI
jgi:hypothetical protein